MTIVVNSQLFTGNGSNTQFTLSQSANTDSVVVIVNGLTQVPVNDYSVNDTILTFTSPPINTTDIEVKTFSTGESGYQGSVGYSGSAGRGDPGFRGSRGDEGYQGSAGYIGSAGPPGGSTGYTGSIGLTGSQGETGYVGSMGLTGRPTRTQFFAADGGSSYSLLENTVNPEHIFVVVNGLLQLPALDYTVSGMVIDFITVPPNNSDIEIRYFGNVVGATGYQGSSGARGPTGFQGSAGDRGFTGSTGNEGAQGFTGSKGDTGPVGAPTLCDKFVSNGSNTVYNLLLPVSNTNHLFVIVNGLVQLPEVDYTIYYTILDEPRLQLSAAPPVNSDIEIRYFTVSGYIGSAGYTGSQGDVGYKGSAGEPGGPTGYTGSIGPAGAGYDGSRGALGYTGSSGFAGSSGISGGRGYTGSVGPIGAPSIVEFYTANGAISYPLNYTVTNPSAILVTVNGLLQMPYNDYTVNSEVSYVDFNSAPAINSDIEVRYFAEAGYYGSTGYQGSAGYRGSAGAAAYSIVYMAPAGPPSPNNGTFWWDTDNGILNIFYEDANNWVGISKGPKGNRGYSGSSGAYAAVGYTGSSGVAGFRGYTGSTGAGYVGSRGELGYTGSYGYTGSTGAGYVGSQGITGYDGSLGYTGSNGFTGSKGDTGQGIIAWVNFDGTGSGAANASIRASNNISNVFKFNTGYYRVYFNNKLVDGNYSVSGIARANNSSTPIFVTLSEGNVPNSSIVDIKTHSFSGIADSDYINITVVR